MTVIEEKQLRGVTPRFIGWIIASTATICSTVLYTYFDFKGSIAAHQEAIIKLESANSVQDQQINALRSDVIVLQFKTDSYQPKTK